MTRTGEQRLLDALIDAPAGTLKAAELSARLRVSTRSVRTYVVAVRRRYGDIVATTRDGYRLDVSAYLGACGSVRDEADGRAAPMTPVERIAWLARTIIAGTSPCDLHALAEAAHVSDSTIESDLVKTRAILAELDVHLVRDRSTISARGTEIALRRAVRRFLVDDVAARTRIADGIATRWAGPAAQMLREGLYAALEAAGLGVNDASAEVLVTHIAVMADRVRQGHTVVSVPQVRDSPALERARESLTALVEELFDVTLPRSEIRYLGFLLAENAIPDRVDMLDDHSAPFVDPKYLALVRTIVDRVLDVYDIDLSGDRFVAFLAMHVQHLSARARAQGSDSRLAAPGLSIRHTHPLVYEIAVFVAQQLEQELDLRIVEAEISLLSFHVGARFQGLHERERRVSVAVVAPRYYDIHRSLSRAVDDAIKGFGKVDIVVTDLATDWDRLSVDAVVSTVAIATSGVPVLRVGVIPTAADLESLSDAIRELARRKLRSRIAADLVEMFDPALFSRGEAGLDSDAMLAHLAGRLADQGYVGSGFVEDVRERERMSPTSFSSGAAIPHALMMNATRAGIAVHVSDSPVPWAGEEVRLVAMFAFTRAQRETMGPLFEGFIHALANADTVRALVQEATSYEGFIQGLLRVL